MKKIGLFLFTVFFLLSCSDNDINNNNPYLPNYSFAFDVNMSLPLYSSLLYPSNGIIYNGQGVKGVIVFNTGSGYVAYDAACPNQAPTSCTAMKIEGINAVCSCDETQYSLFTGLGNKQYPLKQYRVEQNGTVLRVYN
ncbi:Rieske (2Fe-2S) protein [Flavobacterium agrisoli]|uniref:Nitrite reductase/ring-hydroxylating ferredoxin subunit n=1 Tax=Flavobacterium agrisoli TaxID=2793066 RepID=A0A934UL10_9FLAO|nr:hypothetical protein [Flavobacterium agrisoli]MBK0371010.1 hypothetical protein [Flavobacterium agrisoli]